MNQPTQLDPHDQALVNVQQLHALTDRSDLTGPLLEELIRKKTKLNELEIQLAKAVLVPAWKVAWRAIKRKFKIGNPTAN